MKNRLMMAFLLLASGLSAYGQIRNRLGVDDVVFQRYANGRMQQYNPENLLVADSIYRHGVYKNDTRVKMLALSLELPVRFIGKDTTRVNEIVTELKALSNTGKKISEFYYQRDGR